MPVHSAVTVRASVRESSLPALHAALRRLDDDGHAPTGPWTRLTGTHFARFLVLPGDRDAPAGPVPPSLLYLADVDGRAGRHLRMICAEVPEVVDAAFAHCEGYPSRPTDRQRRDWVRAHRIPTAAAYVNTTGLRADQIVAESRLHDWLQTHLDTHRDELARLAPADIHRRLRHVVAAEPSLAFARQAAAGVPLTEKLARVLLVLALLVPALALLPLVIVVAGLGLLAIRRRERTDPASTERPDLASLARLRSREDEFAFNPFAALGPVKPGRLRHVTIRVVVLLIGIGARILFSRGSLAGVTTIHFARWVALDDWHRVIFTSSYDGSLESYMDDFIDKLAWGLNLVFSNGVGYPRTRWMIFGGAQEEQTFKDHLRRHQYETQVSWSAYPTLTCANVTTNAAIRAGLQGELDDAAARTWLARF